jgi:hypothetical protein
VKLIQDPKRIFEIALFLFLTIFLTSRLGTFIHEGLGHALAAVIMGGNVTGMSINLFTTGSCSYDLLSSGLPPRAVVDLAGIVVNFVTGGASLLVLKRIRLQVEMRLILSVFATVSIGSQLLYLVMGTYYGHGDPIIFEELFGPMRWLVWLVFLVLMAPATYFLADAYLRLQEEMVPCNSLNARARILFSTLVAAAVVYGVCFYAEDRSTGFAGGMAASERMIAETAEKAVAGQFLSKEERERQIQAIKKQLRPFPIIVPIFLVCFFSALMAFVKTRGRRISAVHHHFRLGYLWWSLGLSLVVGGIIIWTY